MVRFVVRSRSMVALTACIAVLTLIVTTSVSANPGPGAPNAGSTNAFGVVAQPDGWLIYTNTIASTMTLINPKTTAVVGTQDADGTCHISGSGTAQIGSPGTFSEEVAFNPATCAEKILSGTLSLADSAKLAALSSGNNPLSAISASSPAEASPKVKVIASPAVTTATTYSSAHTKTAWIDPFYITITSLTANLQWPLYGAGGTLTGRVNPYSFAWDGWSTTGPSPISFIVLPGDVGWSMRETDGFTNNDFARYMYQILGPAGWSSCGYQFTTTAHFYHDVTVYGYRNGSRGQAWNDTKDGACSNLVHHNDWEDYGWIS